MSDKLSTSIEQPTVNETTGQHGPSMGFFGIGVLINVLVITAYFLWAFRQSKKPRDRDD